MRKLTVPLILLVFAFTAKAQHIPNGSMESWHQLTSPIYTYVPDTGWYTLDSDLAFIGLAAKPTGVFAEQVYQTNYHHDGASGAKIRTRVQDTIGMAAGCLSNAEDSISYAAILGGAHPLSPTALFFKGGTALSPAQRPATVNMWIQYFPNGADTAHIVARVLNSSGTIIGSVDSMITATIDSFTYITPHITYTATDTAVMLQIIITSSFLGPYRGQDSSILYVDQISYSATAVGVAQNKLQANKVQFYPNPSSGVVYIYSNVNEKLNWQVFNTNGQVIVSKDLAANNREDLSYLPAGTYFYNIMNDKGEVVQKDKFTIAK